MLPRTRFLLTRTSRKSVAGRGLWGESKACCCRLGAWHLGDLFLALGVIDSVNRQPSATVLASQRRRYEFMLVERHDTGNIPLSRITHRVHPCSQFAFSWMSCSHKYNALKHSAVLGRFSAGTLSSYIQALLTDGAGTAPSALW